MSVLFNNNAYFVSHILITFLLDSLREAATETTLVYEGTTNENFDWTITYPQFKQMFNVTEENSKPSEGVTRLFKLFQDEEDPLEEVIDIRPYLILTLLLNSDAKLTLLQTLMFKVGVYLYKMFL